MRKRLPTLSDVARHAGVSYATADRVLNSRGGVAKKSADRVRRAITELGYVRNVAAANLSQGRQYRFAIIIPSGSNAFFGRIRMMIAEAQQRLSKESVHLAVMDVAAFDADALCHLLSGIEPEAFDGVALVGLDDPRVAATVGQLRARGMTVLSLVSDLRPAERDAYVGIDNRVAGSTAARLAALAHGRRPGRVLPIVGALTARDHAERLAGFRACLEQIAPDIEIASAIEGMDRHDLVEDAVAEALWDDRGITAIYSAGAGNSGLVRQLEALPDEWTRPIVVLHELVEHSRRALETGLIDVIIDQRPEEEVARAINYMRQMADRQPPVLPEPIVPAIYVKENLPPDHAASQGD